MQPFMCVYISCSIPLFNYNKVYICVYTLYTAYTVVGYDNKFDNLISVM